MGEALRGRRRVTRWCTQCRKRRKQHGCQVNAYLGTPAALAKGSAPDCPSQLRYRYAVNIRPVRNVSRAVMDREHISRVTVGIQAFFAVPIALSPIRAGSRASISPSLGMSSPGASTPSTRLAAACDHCHRRKVSSVWKGPGNIGLILTGVRPNQLKCDLVAPVCGRCKAAKESCKPVERQRKPRRVLQLELRACFRCSHGDRPSNVQIHRLTEQISELEALVEALSTTDPGEASQQLIRQYRSGSWQKSREAPGFVAISTGERNSSIGLIPSGTGGDHGDSLASGKRRLYTHPSGYVQPLLPVV